MCCLYLKGQTFRIETVSDSLNWLVLQTDSTSDRWQLPYPVYQFQTGDIDGNGIVDAVVGVVKNTRFHREKGRRIFIFKNYRGRVRPLWMGSKLGGELVDFRVIEQDINDKETVAQVEDAERYTVVRALEKTTDNRYFVSDYRWEGFGLMFENFVVENIHDKNTAYEKLSDNTIAGSCH